TVVRSQYLKVHAVARSPPQLSLQHLVAHQRIQQRIDPLHLRRAVLVAGVDIRDYVGNARRAVDPENNTDNITVMLSELPRRSGAALRSLIVRDRSWVGLGKSVEEVIEPEIMHS